MKTPFRKIFISALATFSVFISITFFSCNRDKCKTIVCANGGVCNGGACICPIGYEGSNCETIGVQKFLGNWSIIEKGSITPAAHYTISISADSTIAHVLIYNYYNFFLAPLKGYVTADTLYIQAQARQGKVVFGKGVISSTTTYGQYDQVVMQYEVIDSATEAVDDFAWYATDGSAPSVWNK